MMKSGFKVGDLVLARIKNYPVAVWPARIEVQPEQAKKGQVYVYFFGAKVEEQYGWVANASITKYANDTKEKLSQVSSRADFKAGLEEIENEYKKHLESSASDGGIESGSEKPSSDEGKSEPAKRVRQPKKKFGIESGDTATVAGTKIPKGGNKRKASAEPVENGTKQYKSTDMAESLKEGRSSPSSELNSAEKDVTMDFTSTDDVVPTAHTIGFLGLGIMSTGMVHNLIKTGHKVNIWSRFQDKCTKIKEDADSISEGRVNICEAPCDVMKESDIVFNCSADPESAKKNVFGNCGVTHDNEFLNGKGYVEMTGIDPQTSMKIAEHIQSKGGKYLEAQLQGSREEANDGTLVFLTAGDNGLFMDCQSCFQAMGKSALYLGEVGVASKVYLILQLMQGITLVGLAEGLVLAERCGISGKDIINIFDMTNMTSPYLRNKAHKIVDKDFRQVELSVKNMQKDIRLALGMSDDLMQPLMMASAANEVFKHSRKLGFDDQDCSCIYMKARY